MSVVIPAATQADRRRRFLGLFGAQAGAQPLISRQSSAPFVESFRLLAMNVRMMLSDDPRRAVVVMSPYPKDGRSLVAANLAVALAEQDGVLLVEEQHHGRSRGRSLSDLFLSGHGTDQDGIPAAMRRAVLETGEVRVSFMPRPHDRAIAPGELDRAIAQARDAGMYTVVDSPPALSSSDGFFEAQAAGTVLYVARRTTTDLEVHRRIRDQLERLNVSILGIVLNEY